MTDYGSVRCLIIVGLLCAGVMSADQLHDAAQEGDVEQANLLISKGADVNATDREGWTVLARAASNGHVEVVKLLLSNGADVNATDRQGESDLQNLASRGHVEVVKLLLSSGADVNATDRQDRSVLQGAAEAGHVEVVKLLLSNGADVNATDNSGLSPLSQAVGRGRVEVVKLLLSNGADVNAPRIGSGSRSRSFLGLALQEGHVEIVDLLLSNGAVRPDKEDVFVGEVDWGNTGIMTVLAFNLGNLSVSASTRRPVLVISIVGRNEITFEMAIDKAVKAGLVNEEPHTNAAGIPIGSTYGIQETTKGEVTITCVRDGNVCDVSTFRSPP